MLLPKLYFAFVIHNIPNSSCCCPGKVSAVKDSQDLLNMTFALWSDTLPYVPTTATLALRCSSAQSFGCWQQSMHAQVEGCSGGSCFAGDVPVDFFYDGVSLAIDGPFCLVLGVHIDWIFFLR